jgi:AraC-like DNA-binding protein
MTSPDDTEVLDFVASVSPEVGLELAQLRPKRAILPFWSRLAIAAYREAGSDYQTLARLFHCSRNTVRRALKMHAVAYCTITGNRRLTAAQLALLPPRIR